MRILQSFIYTMVVAFGFLPLFVHAAPIIGEFSPEDDAVGIDVYVIDFSITFDQAVTVGEGFITIKKTNDDSTVETLDVTDDNTVEADETQVFIEDEGVTLEYATDYYVLIDEGAFVGEDEENFAGINDPTVWGFTTRGPVGEPVFNFERVSISDDEEELVEGVSFLKMSADGRYIVFSDGGNPAGLFLRDRTDGSTTLINNDVEIANKNLLSMSDDGVYTAFSTDVSLDAEDLNGWYDVYLYNRNEDSVEYISTNGGGAGAFSNTLSLGVSSSGRYVAFATSDTLLPEAVDGNNLYLRDTEVGTTTLILQDTGETDISFSADENLIALNTSEALDEIDVNGEPDVYVYDVAEDSFELISVTEDGLAAAGQSYFFSSISASGRYVIFTSRAGTLTDDVVDSNDALFLRDRQEGTTTYIVGGTNNFVPSAKISGDEQYIVYSLQEEDVEHIYRYNLNEDITLYITEGTDDGHVGSTRNTLPDISEDGSMVLFVSNGINLIGDDTNERSDVFLWDESIQVEDEDEDEEESVEDNDNSNSSGSSSGGGRRHSNTGLSDATVASSPDEAKVMELQLKLIELLKQLILLLAGQQ